MDKMEVAKKYLKKPLIKIFIYSRTNKLQFKGIIILSIIILYSFGCEKWSAREAVDIAYLESSDYQSFREKVRHEHEEIIEAEKNLAEFIGAKILMNKGKNLKLPAFINHKEIEASIEANTPNRSSLTDLLGFKLNYYPIANAEVGEMDYYLFMTCKVANYKDCIIWFASARLGNLFQVKMICTYKKTLTYGESPAIEMTPSKLNVEVERYVKYPLSTLYNYSLQYNITDSGQIYRARY